jgi:endonuclease/exonuclease/phosphatase family metal-dependent hydrolase
VPEIVVASYNVHCGVDGWGRPFDVEGACRKLDADVLVLQEAFAPDDGPSMAEGLGLALGYAVTAHPLARCRLLAPRAGDAPRPSWGPTRRSGLRPGRGLILRSPRHPGPRAPSRPAPDAPRVGTWDIAVLTRLPLARVEVLDLGTLRADVARRAAISLDVVVDEHRGRRLTVVGTHMSHLSVGSPIQLRRLAGALPRGRADMLVVGDMNLWGPPLMFAFPGLRRVVRGRTWPAWRPLAQTDHILTTPRIAAVTEGEVVDISGSDHLPVRARIRFDD